MTKDKCKYCIQFEQTKKGPTFCECPPYEPSKSKDYCAVCEHPQVVSILMKERTNRIDELDKNRQIESNRIDYAITKIDELERKLTYQDRQIEHCNMIIADQAKIIKEIDNKVKELEFNQSLLASEISKWQAKAFEYSQELNKWIGRFRKLIDAKTEI